MLKREAILQAIATALAGTVEVGDRIYRSRTEAFARNEAPALIVTAGTDSANQTPVSTCWIDWQFAVSIAIYTRGPVPEQLSASIAVDVHSRLMADRFLGGLAMDIWPTETQHLRDQADTTAGWTVLGYSVRYRTRTDSIESA